MLSVSNLGVWILFGWDFFLNGKNLGKLYHANLRVPRQWLIVRGGGIGGVGHPKLW